MKIQPTWTSFDGIEAVFVHPALPVGWFVYSFWAPGSWDPTLIYLRADGAEKAAERGFSIHDSGSSPDPEWIDMLAYADMSESEEELGGWAASGGADHYEFCEEVCAELAGEYEFVFPSNIR